MSNRFLKDADLIKVKAIPAAGANHNTDTIDLGNTTPGVAVEGVELEILIPALAAHTDNTKNVTVKVQDSADNVTFADVEQLAAWSVPGVASTGSAAATRRFRLPADVKRYVQVNIAETSAGANLTASSVTVALVL